MSVLNVHNLAMNFGEQRLFSDVSFDIESKDKVGFIGLNGVGKTTLFKILCGQLEQSDGGVFLAKDATIGYMEQHACSTKDRSIYSELLSVFDDLISMENELEYLSIKLSQTTDKNDDIIIKHAELLEKFERNGGLTYKSRTRATLIGLGFTEEQFNMPTEKLSGGQRSKISLAKLLLSKSTILLLDEPTNHLDINSVIWLENFIKNFDGAMIIISHDRYFLDAVTNKTIELENQHIRLYTGNYSEYIRKKQQVDEAVKNKYENDLKEIKRIEGIIEQQKRFNQAHNYVTAASKQKEIDRIKDRLITPEQAQMGLQSFRLEPSRESGRDVLICNNIAKAFGKKQLFKNISFTICKGERVFLLGANGCGKTTFFRILTDEVPKDDGDVTFGSKVDVGYFDQMQGNLDLNKTAIDWIWDTFPQMTETAVRSALGSFLFKGDDVFKPISKMSGGERARLSMLRLMLRGDNFLLLDEPTNHLDTASREALEETLQNYSGTMLLVSHDRYFINKLADKILILTNDGVREYIGNYDYYAEKQANLNAKNEGETSQKAPKVNEYKLRKEQQAAERKRLSQIKKLEQEISDKEQLIQDLNNQLLSEEVSSNYEQLVEITNKLEQEQTNLDILYDSWAELN